MMQEASGFRKPALLTLLEASEDDAVVARLYSPWHVHLAMYRLFARSKKEFRPFLYDDRGIRHGRWSAIVLSDRTPDAAALPQGVSFAAKSVPEAWFGAERYRFALSFAPIRRNRSGETYASTHSGAAAWLASKSADWGFKVDPAHFDVQSCDPVYVHKSSGETIVFRKAKAGGILCVTDRERFLRAALSGVGRLKSYGCGLLQIAPLGGIRSVRRL